MNKKDFETMDIIDLIICIECSDLTDSEYIDAVNVAKNRVPSQISSKY